MGPDRDAYQAQEEEVNHYRSRVELERDLARRFEEAQQRQRLGTALVLPTETPEARRKRSLAEIEVIYGKRRAG